jgi:hypothetical protein
VFFPFFFDTKMGRIVISAAALALAVASARATSVLYVTDMPAFEALVYT